MQGELPVPENRRRAGSRTIALRYRKLGAEGRPVVFHFTGGPGMSNLAQKYPGALLQRFTVVELGYRGIDSSVRLRSPLLDRALGGDRPLSPEGKRRLAAAFDESVRRWRAEGIDLQGYQIADVAGDAEDLRRLLGGPPIHLLADSYGTRVALEYLSRHPGAVGRAVLVGANPPGHFFWSSEDVRSGFEAYERAMGTPDLERRIVETLARLPRTAWGIRLDADRIRIVAFFLLFHRRTARHVFDAFARARRDASYLRLALLSAGHSLVMSRVMDEWGDLFWKGLVTDWEPGADYGARSAAAPGRFGSPVGELLFSPPYSPELLADRDPARALAITTPTLVLSGALDFSTPPGNAQRELAEAFPAVKQVVFPTYGHVADFWAERDALSALLHRYLVEGVLPSPSDLPDRAAELPTF